MSENKKNQTSKATFFSVNFEANTNKTIQNRKRLKAYKMKYILVLNDAIRLKNTKFNPFKIFFRALVFLFSPSFDLGIGLTI